MKDEEYTPTPCSDCGGLMLENTFSYIIEDPHDESTWLPIHASPADCVEMLQERLSAIEEPLENFLDSCRQMRRVMRQLPNLGPLNSAVGQHWLEVFAALEEALERSKGKQREN